jgi:hypothetical protein
MRRLIPIHLDLPKIRTGFSLYEAPVRLRARSRFVFVVCFCVGKRYT